MTTSTLVNNVKVVSMTVGTGTLTLGTNVEGYAGTADLTNGTTYSYSVHQDALWEYGRGVYTAASHTLTRGVLKSFDGTAEGTSPVALGPGANIAVGVLLVEDLSERIGIPANFTIGMVTAVPNGTPPSVTISGTSPNFVLDMALETGPNGTTPTFTIGTVTTLSPGSSATATLTGTPPAYVLNLGLPAGATGATGAVPVFTIGTVTAGTAAVTVTGTATNPILNFVLQAGPTGATGAAGPSGYGTYPNGTMRGWLAPATTAGAAASAADQLALRYLEYGLRELQLNEFFLRINPLFGDIAAGARVPFLQAPNVGFSADTGTISSWTESDGLKTGPIDTGVPLQAGRLDVRDCLLGIYNLADPNGGVGSGFSIGNASQGWGLQSDRTGNDTTSSAGLFLFDVPGAIFGSTYRRTTGPTFADCTTKGPMSGYRASDGRNGIVLCDYPLVNGNFGDRRPVDPTLTIAEPSGTIQVTGKSTHGCGGYWIARGMPEPATIAYHRLYHRCMIIAGRAVDAEGY